VKVLVEEKLDKATGRLRGFSRNYLPVTLSGGAANEEIAVLLESLENGRLIGHAINEPDDAPGVKPLHH